MQQNIKLSIDTPLYLAYDSKNINIDLSVFLGTDINPLVDASIPFDSLLDKLWEMEIIGPFSDDPSIQKDALEYINALLSRLEECVTNFKNKVNSIPVRK